MTNIDGTEGKNIKMPDGMRMCGACCVVSFWMGGWVGG